MNKQKYWEIYRHVQKYPDIMQAINEHSAETGTRKERLYIQLFSDFDYKKMIKEEIYKYFLKKVKIIKKKVKKT